jgi:hypothetical protein
VSVYPALRGEHGGQVTEMQHAAAVCRNMLVVADARAEVVPKLS